LGIVGVETQVSGSLLMINDQPVLIAEACNGMRMVFPLLLIAYGFSFGLPLRASVRIIIVLASPIVALLCNVLRVLPLIWLQGQGRTWQTWGEWLHEHSGWIMVPLAFLVLLGLIRLLKWATVPVYRYPLASQSA
jgi:exosortase/archaeosortase family protein